MLPKTLLDLRCSQQPTTSQANSCCWSVFLQVVLSWCSASSRHTSWVSMLAAATAGLMLCGLNHWHKACWTAGHAEHAADAAGLDWPSHTCTHCVGTWHIPMVNQVPNGFHAASSRAVSVKQSLLQAYLPQNVQFRPSGVASGKYSSCLCHNVSAVTHLLCCAVLQCCLANPLCQFHA